MTTAIVFSGQGSQNVGMGADFYQAFLPAREVFEEVDETLHFALSRLIFEGPEEVLNQTQHAQAAIMAVSIAIWRVFHPACHFMAGHSLGEYSSLCAADALSLEETTRLLKHRGEAFSKIQGAMLVLLGLPLDKVQQIAHQTDTFVANENSALQTVLSGTTENIKKAEDVAHRLGARHTVILPVSGPFHSPLMVPAQQELEPLLKKANIRTPRIPVISNVTAQPMTDPDDIKAKLIEQVTSTVHWQACVQNMVNLGVDEFIEIGAGRVLTGLIKRIAPEAKTYSVNCVKDLDNLK